MRIVLMYSTHKPSADHLRRLQCLAPRIEAVVAQDEQHAIEISQQAQIILGHRYLRQVVPTAHQLQFVQSTAGGVDRLPLDQLSSMGVRLCRCTVTSPAIARHAVASAWAIARQLHIARDRQNESRWDTAFDWPASPRSAVVVGAGSIGKEIARLLGRDGVEVIGVRASSPALRVEGFSRVYGPDSLSDLLPDCDWCFLSLPLTDESRGLFDLVMLSRLDASAVLVNVGRGELIDTAALCGLMRQGHLAGAALDVLPAEAKAADHPIWSTPRVLITPHVSSHYAKRAEDLELFAEAQVQAFTHGGPLSDEVILSNRRGCV